MGPGERHSVGDDWAELLDHGEDEHQAVFVGDGIDGAPALTAFTVGLAFGQNSDVTAGAASGVVLEAKLRRVGEGAPAADHPLPEVVVAGAGGGLSI